MSKKICILNGSPRLNGNTKELIKHFVKGAEEAGHQLVIVSAGHGHADLTDEYAAIPAEMKAVAALFDAPVLRGIGYDELMEKSQQ